VCPDCSLCTLTVWLNNSLCTLLMLPDCVLCLWNYALSALTGDCVPCLCALPVCPDCLLCALPVLPDWLLCTLPVGPDCVPCTLMFCVP